MLNQWLSCSQRMPSPYPSFGVMDVIEAQPLNPAVTDHLRDLLLEARIGLDFLIDAADNLGWKDTLDWVLASFPNARSARRGEFGEVLSAAVLVQFHDYVLPIQKLRFAIAAGQSLPGTDFIAFKSDDIGICEICLVEAKLRTVSDGGAAVSAYEQLREDHNLRFPEMLRFVALRLFEQASPLYHDLMAHMRDRQDTTEKESFGVSLVWEKDKWSERVLENLQDNEVELAPLTVHVELIHDVAQLAKALFNSIGAEMTVDDD